MKGIITTPLTQAPTGQYDIHIRENSRASCASKFIFINQTTEWAVSDLIRILDAIAQYIGPAPYLELYVEKYNARVFATLDMSSH